MNDGIYKIGPVYNSRVKISDWFERFLKYPVDYPKNCKKGGSHYKTFGPTDEVFVPKTTTQEMLEQYRNVRKVTKKGLLHPMINFTSYPLIANGKAFNEIKTLKEPKKSKCQIPPITSYKYDYYNKRQMTYKSSLEICNEEPLHPLLNRLPKSDFDRARQVSTTMFMDDHFYNLSEQRKCNNFLRQLKKISYVPWLGDYQKLNKTSVTEKFCSN